MSEPRRPAESFRTSHAERWAPWLAGALLALPVLLFHYPPMADLPLHEAVVGLLRHWGDPAWVPPAVYELNPGPGNQLFYVLILLVSYVAPVGVASKVVVAATLFALPPSVGRLAAWLGVTRWAAVVVAPLGLGWLFFMGLLANLVGLDVWLLLLPTLDRFCERPRARPLASVCAGIVVLHFAHDLMALVAAGTLVVLSVGRTRGLRGDAVRGLPVVLAIVLALGGQALGAPLTNKRHLSANDHGWDPPGHKLAALPMTLHGGFEPEIRNLLFAVCLAPIVLFAFERWRRRQSEPRTLAWTTRFRFELVCAGLLLCYFAAPADVKGTTLIYERFLAPAWILLALAACTRASTAVPFRAPRLLAPFLPLVALFAALPAFAENGRIYQELDALLPRMETGSTYLVGDLDQEAPDTLVHPKGAVGHVVGTLGGRGFYDFSWSESALVHQKRDEQWSMLVGRLEHSTYAMIPSYDLTHFRYVLLHSSDPVILQVAILALAPEARPVTSEGSWTLLESTLPLVPRDSPDEPGPVPGPTTRTLHDRCLEVVERIRKSPT